MYNLAQFHVHAPAEHSFNGITYDAEVHFVHKSKTGLLAVQGIWFKQSSVESPFFKSALAHGIANDDPNQAPITVPIINMKTIYKTVMASMNSSYSYTGSLTTPPCSADSGPVMWSVSRAVQPISIAQLNMLMKSQNGIKTNRPVTNIEQPTESHATAAESHGAESETSDSAENSDDSHVETSEPGESANIID